MKMFARQSILKGSLRAILAPTCERRQFNVKPHIFSSKCLNSRRVKSIQFQRYVSNQSNKNKGKSYIPFILGITAVGGAVIYAYNAVFKKSHPSEADETEDDIDYEPFINEHLEEDLALLKEFGQIPYLLVGSGSASFTAFKAIRTRDPVAKVLIIGDEPFLPYMRPPLSKEMWFDRKTDVAETLTFTQWNGKERSLFYEPEDFYFSIKDLLESKNGGVSIIRGKKVKRIDPVSQIAYLDNEEEISYAKCLLATGSKPKNLPVFEEADESVKKHVTLFRTIRDFQKLDKISKKVKKVAIVGGGFLGSELACGLAKRGSLSGLDVIQIFPESGNMGKILPEYLCNWTTKKLQNEGVHVIPDVTVESVVKKDKKVELHLSNNEVVSADHIVVAVGAEPNIDIARTSGLEVDENHGGFLVNTEMEARKNLWIAGDASCFYDVKLGRRRVEHHDHAIVSGRLAGENMTGSGKPYWHQSMFWSDLGPDVGFEAIGIVDSVLPTVGVFAKATESDNPKAVVDSTGESIRSETEKSYVSEKETTSQSNEIPRAPQPTDNYSKGVIFYLRENVIVGIVLWNVFAKMSVARKIISESKSYEDLAEVAKLFELHSTE